MPIGDWQFWVVTAIALVAVFSLFRMVMPKKKGKRTNLTVSAKKHLHKDSSDTGCSR